MATDRTFADINGAPFDFEQRAADHSLKIDPPFQVANAGYIARAVAFQEGTQRSRHTIGLDGFQVLDKTADCRLVVRLGDRPSTASDDDPPGRQVPAGRALQPRPD